MIVTFPHAPRLSLYLQQVPILERNHNIQNLMTIKGMNGEQYNVTGSGQGNYNTVGK